MEINSNTLAMLTQAVNASFVKGLGHKSAPWDVVGMEIPSMTSENVYPYLKNLGVIRTWVGERQIQNLSKLEFKVGNEDWESTYGISRNAVLDDQFGLYGITFEQVGRLIAEFPAKGLYQLLKSAFTTLGPDGQYFIDVDHPVGQPGKEVSVSNHMGGAGAPWFVVDASQAIKPLIYQNRQAFNLVTLFNPDDPSCFFNKQFIWGVDGRAAFAFGPFWQLLFGSKQTIDDTNVTALLSAMASQLDDNGEPLGIRGTHFIGTPAQAETARRLFSMQTLASGAQNPLYNRLQVVDCPWLL